MESLIGEEPELLRGPADFNNTMAGADLRWTFVRAGYFVMATCTTVGYGEFYPSTALGQIFMIVAVLGVGSVLLLSTFVSITTSALAGSVGGAFI